MSIYSFIPWVRRGLSRRITEKDTLGATDGQAVERASIDIDLWLRYIPVGSDEAADDRLLVERTANLVGPGDAVGVRRKALIETVPARNTQRFPANHLAYITFFDEDLPWRFTPAAPNGLKLRPWLALIVLAHGQGDNEEFDIAPRAERPDVLTIKAPFVSKVLPPPDEVWAWAHVQASTPVNSADELETLQKDEPNLALSRIVAPRRLQPDTKYTACLVPTFEDGCRAGLGESVEGIRAQAPAWPRLADLSPGGSAHPPQDLRLPIYHRWTFETRGAGDFETLVSALRPRIAGPTFGLRDVDISQPGFGLDGLLPSTTLLLEGALRPPGYEPPAFPDGSTSQGEYADKLQQVLELSTNLSRSDGGADLPTVHPYAQGGALGYAASVAEDPIIAPPTYGQWHAMVERVSDAPSNRSWLDTLNLDPRQRIAAGAGSQIVQARDEELAERAWEQVGEVLAANQRIREAELAKHVAAGMHDKHLAPLDDDRLLTLARQTHAGTLDPTSRKTVRRRLDESPIPSAAMSPAFRRAARPQRKGLRRAMRGAGRQAELQAGLITALHDGELVAAATKSSASSSIGIEDVEGAVDLASQQIATEAQAPAQQFLMLLYADLSPRTSPLPPLATWKNQLLAGATTPEVTQLVTAIVSVAASPGSATIQVQEAVFHQHFEADLKGKYYNGLVVEADAGAGRYARAVLPLDVETYRDAVTRFRSDVLDQLPIPAGPNPVASFGQLQSSFRGELDPRFALPHRLAHIVKVPGASAGGAPLPVMAYPSFPEPQYDHVEQLDPELIIPNVAELRSNTMTLLETNQRFIEALLAGMNHEMARELLWREYPTDRRGTYFDRFWDASDSLQDDPPADIHPMHQWTAALGQHSQRAEATLLVLTIRSELFRQYPRTLVYAHRALWQTQGGVPDREAPRRLVDPPGSDDWRWPVFSAELGDDIALFAFALDADEARGIGNDPGWFFVLKERPGQPRLGADEGAGGPLNSWNDLTYGHVDFPAETGHLVRVGPNAGLTTGSNDPSEPTAAQWGRSSADMAYLLLQAPILYARHAAEMMPPG